MGRINPILLGLIIGFAALAKGAHDLWAATVIWLVVLIFFSVRVIRLTWKSDSPGIRLGLIPPLLALIGVFCLSFRLSINPEESRFALTDWVFACFLFLIVLNSEWDTGNLELLTLVLVPVFWIQLGAMLVQQAHWNAGLNPMENPGTLINANFGAAFSLFWVPVLLDQLLTHWGQSKWEKLYLASGLAALLVNLFLFESTWAYICLATGVLIWAWPQFVSSMFTRHKIATSLGLLLFLSVIGFVVWEKLHIPSDIPGRDAGSRIIFWKTAYRIWKAHLWKGIGLGNYPSAFLAYKVGEGENTLFVHSFPLGLLAETGILGLGAFLYLIVTWKQSLWFNRIAHSNRWPYAAGVVTFLLFSVISLSYELFVNLLTFFLFLALSLGQKSLLTFKFRRSALIVLLAVGVFSLPFLVSPFLASQNVVYGRKKLLAGDLGEAARAFQSAVVLDPRSSEAHRGMAKVLSSQNVKEAIKEQQLAVSKNKLNAVLWWELGRYLEQNGNIPDAISAYKEASFLHPANIMFQEEAVRLEGTL